MSTSRTLLWSSAVAGSLLFALTSAAGCSDEESPANQDAGGSSSGGSSSGGSSSGGSSSGGSSSGGSSSGGSSSGGSSSGGSSSGGDAGTSIPVPDGATLRWTSQGGFRGPTSDASTCQPSDDLFVYDLSSRSLTWKLCRPVGFPEEPVYAYEQGASVLDAADDAAVRAALGDVVRNSEVVCGADKPYVELTVIEPNDAETKYVDQFQHCSDDGKTYVDGLDALGNAFDAAAVE